MINNNQEYKNTKIDAITLVRIRDFRFIRDIPYKIPLALDEPDHCCNGKHTALYTLLEKTGLEVRPRVCLSSWKDFNVIPKDIRAIPHEDEVEHIYLEARINGKWKRIDATLDKALESVLPVNEWDGKNSTPICVKPKHIYSPQDSLAIFYTELSDKDFKNDIKNNWQFYKAINDWFEDIRRGNCKK